MPASWEPISTGQAWLEFFQKYQPKLSAIYRRGTTPGLSPFLLERARQEWLLELKTLDCGRHGWPSLPEEIGQLQLVLQWGALEMWNNFATRVTRLSAHDPQKQSTPSSFSRRTRAKEKEQRAVYRPKSASTQTPNLNANTPADEPKSNADTEYHPHIAILSPRLYGLTPNLFHKVWTSEADSSGLKDYALLKWRALMKEFYAMAKEYAERMEEVLRRIQGEQEVRKLLSIYDLYHQQLADNVYKDWEQAISKWREEETVEKKSDAPNETTNENRTVDKGEALSEQAGASEKRSFSQREDHHDMRSINHEHLDVNQTKRKKASSVNGTRNSSTNELQVFTGTNDFLPGAEPAQRTTSEKDRFIRPGQQVHQSRAKLGCPLNPMSANIAPAAHVDRDSRRAKSAPAQRRYSPRNPGFRSSIAGPLIRAGDRPPAPPPASEVSRNQSETTSYNLRAPPELGTLNKEGQTGMRMKGCPPPPRRSDGSSMDFKVDRTSSRYHHGTAGGEQYPEVPFRDYSNLSVHTQHCWQSSAKHDALKISANAESGHRKTSNALSAAPGRFWTTDPIQNSYTQYAAPKATSPPAIIDQADQDDWLPPDISAKIEVAYAEAGRKHAEEMQWIDSVYSRLEEGNPRPWESEAEDDVLEVEETNSGPDTTESDTILTGEDTGSDFGSDVSTPTPGSPVMFVTQERIGPQMPRVVGLVAEDKIPMNSQWKISGIFREQRREKTVR